MDTQVSRTERREALRTELDALTKRIEQIMSGISGPNELHKTDIGEVEERLVDTVADAIVADGGSFDAMIQLQTALRQNTYTQIVLGPKGEPPRDSAMAYWFIGLAPKIIDAVMRKSQKPASPQRETRETNQPTAVDGMVDQVRELALQTVRPAMLQSIEAAAHHRGAGDVLDLDEMSFAKGESGKIFSRLAEKTDQLCQALRAGLQPQSEEVRGVIGAISTLAVAIILTTTRSRQRVISSIDNSLQGLSLQAHKETLDALAHEIDEKIIALAR